jgi:hypothetical protein
VRVADDGGDPSGRLAERDFEDGHQPEEEDQAAGLLLEVHQDELEVPVLVDVAGGDARAVGFDSGEGFVESADPFVLVSAFWKRKNFFVEIFGLPSLESILDEKGGWMRAKNEGVVMEMGSGRFAKDLNEG